MQLSRALGVLVVLLDLLPCFGCLEVGGFLNLIVQSHVAFYYPLCKQSLYIVNFLSKGSKLLLSLDWGALVWEKGNLSHFAYENAFSEPQRITEPVHGALGLTDALAHVFHVFQALR